MTNFHTHTTYCDGKESAEAMVLGAINRGFTSLGFSGHAHTAFETYNMTLPGTAQYCAEVLNLKEKYKDSIELRLGVEQDIYSDTSTDGYEFVIGSTHSVLKDGAYHTVDYHTAPDMVREVYGGDWYALAKDYYETHSQTARVTGCQIIGHFDVVRMMNEGERYFSTSDRRYTHAATEALDELMKDCRLFELNTGGMYKKRLSDQYPQAWILREIKARGGDIILSSDSHDVPSLGYMFDEMTELLRSLGITPVSDYK